MQSLIPIKLKIDESLESYFLRLSAKNLFDSYLYLSDSLWQWLMEFDHEAAGAFPRELSLLNVYHADRTSSLRVRAFQLVQRLTDNEELPLLKLAITNSNIKYAQGLAAVLLNGVAIPRCFLRTDTIPVCPECLKESPYIRQNWHIEPYKACHHHKCELLHQCPECHESLNYQLSESISLCVCDFDLSSASTKQARKANLSLSQVIAGELNDPVNPLLATTDLSIRFCAILWYLRHQQNSEQEFLSKDCCTQDSSVVNYFANWPHDLHHELDNLVSGAELKLIKKFNKTGFSTIFGDFILSCKNIPVRDIQHNFILNTLTNYLVELVGLNPKAKQANIADLLLSVLEVSILLSTSHDQVYRLYQEGYLELSFTPKLHAKLPPHQPAFYLRQVIELRTAKMQSLSMQSQHYLPAW